MGIQFRATARKLVDEMLAEEFAAINASTPADPFLIDHDCLNPAGHDFVSSCGHVACVHCARLAWR